MEKILNRSEFLLKNDENKKITINILNDEEKKIIRKEKIGNKIIQNLNVNILKNFKHLL